MKVNRAVFIGGFGNGAASAERVAEALTTYYDDADVFTFSKAMRKPDKVSKAVVGVDTFTHSAGMLALEHTYPTSITAFNAPLPTSKKHLIGKTLHKTARMHAPGVGIHSAEDVKSVALYDASATGELILHTVGNLRHLGRIAEFDAIASAAAANSIGISTELIYTDDDVYFQVPDHYRQLAERINVGLQMIPGEHDELALRPDQTLHAVLG